MTELRQQAIELADNHELDPQFAASVADYIKRNTGSSYTIEQLDRELGSGRDDAKKRARQAVTDLALRAGYIQKDARNGNRYTVPDRTLRRIDLHEQQGQSLPVWLPFGLNQCVTVQPKNIITVAGETNAGKTALMLRMARYNMLRPMPITYLSSEMSGVEFRNRIESFGDTVEQWESSMRIVDRNKDFHTAIDPDGLNFIDFLEIHDNFYLVGQYMRQIHDALRSGVAVVAIQKKRGEMFARGGEFANEKARLAISMFCHGRTSSGIYGSTLVTKAKNYVKDRNPEGMEIFYSLRSGNEFDTQGVAEIPMLTGMGGWRYLNAKSREGITKTISEYCEAQHLTHFEPVNFDDGAV